MASASIGLSSTASAPFARALAFKLADGNAVMKMVGGASPSAMMRSCISTPDMPGIMTSEIRHDVETRWPDRRNSSADANRRVCCRTAHKISRREAGALVVVNN